MRRTELVLWLWDDRYIRTTAVPSQARRSTKLRGLVWPLGHGRVRRLSALHHVASPRCFPSPLGEHQHLQLSDAHTRLCCPLSPHHPRAASCPIQLGSLP